MSFPILRVRDSVALSLTNFEAQSYARNIGPHFGRVIMSLRIIATGGTFGETLR